MNCTMLMHSVKALTATTNSSFFPLNVDLLKVRQVFQNVTIFMNIQEVKDFFLKWQQEHKQGFLWYNLSFLLYCN